MSGSWSATVGSRPTSRLNSLLVRRYSSSRPTRWPNSCAAVSPVVVSGGLEGSALAVGPTYQLLEFSRTIGGLCSSISQCGLLSLKIGSNTSARRWSFSMWNLLFQRLAMPSRQIFLCASPAASPLSLMQPDAELSSPVEDLVLRPPLEVLLELP